MSLVVRVASTAPSVDSPYGYAPGNALDFRQLGAFDIGYMRNLDSSRAIGGLIEVGTNGVDKRLALKARGQAWLTPSLAASIGVGVMRAEQLALTTNGGTTYAYGATADVGLDAADAVGVFVTGDLTRQAGRRVSALRVGLREDSYAAVWEAALFAFIDVTVISPFIEGGRPCCAAGGRGSATRATSIQFNREARPAAFR